MGHLQGERDLRDWMGSFFGSGIESTKELAFITIAVSQQENDTTKASGLKAFYIW